MAKEKSLRILLLSVSLMFFLPILFFRVHPSLANIRFWQILFSVLCFPVFFRFLRSPDLDAAFLPKAWIGIVLFSALLLYFADTFSSYYAISVNGIDFSFFDHMLLTKLMYSPFHGYSHLGIHQSWILYLLIPFHNIFQSPLFLLSLNAVLMWIPVFPLWKLARLKGLNECLSALLCFAYLTSPFVGTLVNSGFRIESFIPLVSLSFFYFWYGQKTAGWVLFLLLFLSVKEDMAFYLIPFLFAEALLKRERRRSATLAALFSLGVLYVNLVYVQPYFLQVAPEYLGFWKGYGRTKLEILQTIFSSPGKVITDLLTSGFWKVYGPLLGLPFLSLPIFIASFPNILLMGLADRGLAISSFSAYYPITLVCLAFVALINVISEENVLSRWPWVKRGLMPVLIFVFPLFHGGYIRLRVPDLETYTDLQKAREYLENYHLHDLICAQGIAQPYLKYRLRLRNFDEACLSQENTLALIVPGKDSYPYREEDIRVFMDTYEENQVRNFGSVHIFRGQSLKLRRKEENVRQ